MKKVIRLTESDLIKIVNNVVSEQSTKGVPIDYPKFSSAAQRGPGMEKTRTIQKSITIPGNLFPTGSDKVSEDSEAYAQASSAINSALNKTKELTVTVVGGASVAVNPNFKGDPVEFNTRLAQKRSNNFVTALKRNFPNVKFTVGKPIVDTNAKVLNSKEALKAQNVVLNFSTTEEQRYVTQAIDNTAVVKRPNIVITKDKVVPVKNSDTYIVCFEVDSSLLDVAIKAVKAIQGVVNLTYKKKEKSFWDRWFG